MRMCRKCGLVKSTDEFTLSNQKKPTHTCKECKRKYDVEYRKKNWSRLYSQIKEYERNHPETIKAIRSKSKRKHAARRNAEWHKRYAASKGAEGFFTHEEWMKLCDRTGNVCLTCKQSKSLTKDHIIPLSKGGSNWISNIQPLCQSCNSRKRDKIIDYR